MNANLKRLICHFPIPRLVILFMLAWVRPAFGDAPVTSTSQYTGIVVDGQGRPVAGATVDCYRYQSSEAWFDNAQAELEQKQQTATDGKGAFAISAWPGRTLVVVQNSDWLRLGRRGLRNCPSLRNRWCSPRRRRCRAWLWTQTASRWRTPRSGPRTRLPATGTRRLRN